MKKLYDALDNLISKHKNNDYIMGRLEMYMTQLLPNALETETQTHARREQRKHILNEGKEKFIERFLCKNNYYYCANNALFVNYDGTHFLGHSEEKIHHQILSTITQEQGLIPWKHKIANEIIRTIKNRSPIQAIPESLTIQFVLNTIIHKLFQTRYAAKYFLTLLGDNILGKAKPNIVYIISPIAKELIQAIGYTCNIYFGNANIVQNIKYKYYDHDYANCRLLKINTNSPVKFPELCQEISKHIIDFLCVAYHYSTRYESADKYLEHCTDSEFVSDTLYLSNNTPETIVTKFISETIETCDGSSIESKSIIFIWKKYLKDKNLPNILFYEPLKTILKDKLQYDPDQDLFINITSKYIPNVGNFLEFWRETIVTDPSDEELEIEEITFLFKKWNKKYNLQTTETFILDLIRHYYPSVEIIDNKYLLDIKCNMWDKRQDVVNSLEYHKLMYQASEKKQIVTISTAYQHYVSTNNLLYRVSKRYYEKVCKEELEGKLDSDGIITF